MRLIVNRLVTESLGQLKMRLHLAQNLERPLKHGAKKPPLPLAPGGTTAARVPDSLR